MNQNNKHIVMNSYMVSFIQYLERWIHNHVWASSTTVNVHEIKYKSDYTVCVCVCVYVRACVCDCSKISMHVSVLL